MTIDNDARPLPDDLLARITETEAAKGRANLKIFLGMCAGVGKTYAMLEEARAARRGGRDVVVGLALTHGRPETEELLADLELLPLRRLEYRGMALEEIDVEAILARRPEIVVIDELAHTNVPGSRHVKRWQDIFELLDQGLSVWTAINVQHIESLSDVVEDICGVAVRERVPDPVLDRADEIRLIDVSPEGLVRRLAEGKVYEGEGARAAANGFFKPRTLGALRELSLRFTTRAAERKLRTYARAESLLLPRRDIEGKILVAVSPSPSSAYLVRWARRRAYALRSAWIAVHVDSGLVLTAEDERKLEENLALARKLGAETFVLQSADIAYALVETARTEAVSMIVIGRSGLSRLGFLPKRATVSDRIIREAGPIDVAIVEDASTPRIDITLAATRRFFAASRRQYAFLLLVFASLLGLGYLLSPLIGYRGIALIYLAAVLALSLVTSPGPVAILAVLSALALNFLFIPPRFTFSIGSAEDLLLFAIYFLVAFVTGSLVARLKANERMLGEGEKRAAFLFRAAERLARAHSIEEASATAAETIEQHFGTRACIFASEVDGSISGDFVGLARGDIDTREMAAVSYAFSEGCVCGSSTDSLPAARLRYIPALLGEKASGVIGLVLPEGRPWRKSDDNLLLSLGRTFAFVVERELSEARRRKAAMDLESERLSKVLLDSVSHELRTPLTTITGSISALKDSRLAELPEARNSLIDGALDSAKRLDRIVEDILSMSRIDSGALRTARMVVDLADIANTAMENLGDEIAQERVHLRLPRDPYPVKVDLGLAARLVTNLLRNAARYSPPEASIELEMSEGGEDLAIRVRDHGPGVADSELQSIFERFKRGERASGGGLGLGLAICRGIAAAHGGTIVAHNAPSGGLEVKALFPSCVERPLP